MVDSALNDISGATPWHQWPSLACQMLYGLQGCNIQDRNLGMSGSRTRQLVARLPSIFTFGVPDIVAFLVGINDGTTQGGFTAQSANSTSITLSTSDFREDNFCQGQTVQITSGTGTGSTAVIASYNGATSVATISGSWSGTTPSGAVGYQWNAWVGSGLSEVQTNLTTAIQYCLTGGVKKILVLDTVFDNTSGGETVASPNTVHQTIRGYQLAAVNSFSVSNPGQVVYSGLWTYMGNVINGTGGQSNIVTVNGTPFTISPNVDTSPAVSGYAYGYSAGSAINGIYGWGIHRSSSNGHLNQIGQTIVAQNVYNAIVAQSGWVSSLIP